MINQRRALFCLLTLLVGLLGCAATAPLEQPPAAVAYTGQVMLYSSMQENQILAIKEGFEEKYPGVEMGYYFASTAKVLTKLATEGQSNRFFADVLWVGDPSNYISLKNSGVLAPYISPQGIHIDPIYIDADSYFTGARLLSVGIAYNTDLVTAEQAPKSWQELLDPKWSGKLVMSDPGSAGTIRYFVGAMMADERYGEQFFARLRENGCELESGSAATHQQVASGNYMIGICLDYVTANLAASGEPLAFVYPQQDTVSLYSPVGLVSGSANLQNGKLLYDFILSKEGQEILVENNLTSIRTDVEQRGASLSTIAARSLAVDLDWVAENAEDCVRRFDAIFG